LNIQNQYGFSDFSFGRESNSTDKEELVMNANRSRTNSPVPGFLLALTAVFLTQGPTASAAIFEIEGRYITIFGYTFCAYDCGYESNAVRLVRQPVVAPIEHR
jgi:hypothetical protein